MSYVRSIANTVQFYKVVVFTKPLDEFCRERTIDIIRLTFYVMVDICVEII